MVKLIALDRDGVINKDSPFYIKSPDQWFALPGSLEAIARLKQHGYQVVVVTNQSGIARGYFTVEVLDAIHRKMSTQITASGGCIEEIFVCPHAPSDNCDCRKPKPGLLLQAANKFGVRPEEILMIGDAASDVLTAKNCGARAILIKNPGKVDAVTIAKINNVPIYDCLAMAVDHFLDQG